MYLIAIQKCSIAAISEFGFPDGQVILNWKSIFEPFNIPMDFFTNSTISPSGKPITFL